MAQQEFKTPQDALAHYGKKGMKWGVRNEDKPTGGSAGSTDKPEPIDENAYSEAMKSFYSKKSDEDLQAEGQKKLEAQAEVSFPSKKEVKRNAKADRLEQQAAEMANLAEKTEAKRNALGKGVGNRIRRASLSADINSYRQYESDLKKQASQVRDGKLTDNQKVLLTVGAAAAIGGLALYGSSKYGDYKDGITPSTKKRLYDENKAQTDAEWRSLFGRDHDGEKSLGGFYTASQGGFFGGLKNQKAMDRPEFTIPKGTVFQRFSNHEEDSSQYGTTKGVYSTFLSNDKKMYGASGEFGSKKFVVNFKAEDEVRVPSLKTVLSHLQQVREKEYPDSPQHNTPEKIFTEYHGFSGGSWDSKTATRLFESLKSAGYSAIVDDMDAGYLGDLPVVFFGNAAPATSRPRGKNDTRTDSHGIMKLSNSYA